MPLTPTHEFWMQCGRAFRRFAAGAIHDRMALFWLLLALSIVPAGVRAEPIETEHLFAFTIGSDVGDVGDREIEGSATSRFSKRTGTYDAGSGTMSAEFVPLPNLRTEFTGIVDAYDISGVSGFTDQHETAFGGLSVDIRYRLLDRGSAPFGLAIGAEPQWDRVDDLTGERVSQYGVDLVAAADWEIVRDRIVAAVNLLYQPYATRFRLTGVSSQEATAGLAGALMAQIRSGFFIGGEARYLRQYDGLGFDSLAGQGFFVGPTVYFKLSDQAWLTLAWSSQVAGHAKAVAGSLDLVNFERQQARVLFGVNF
ncbi:MAG TPA: hypothetical protein VMU69_25050 [Bradyrhizobium sp.]|nr:hypothetical protein [Bradyrhizobium sp.]